MKISERKQAFGSIAKDYQKYRGTYNKKVYTLLASLIKKPSAGSTIPILDLGCGTGISTEPLVDIKQSEVIGCDPDSLMLKEARVSAQKKGLPIKYIEGKAEKIPLKDDSLAGIISAAAFHWFANERTMKEIKRVLMKNGIFFVFWKLSAKTSNPTIGGEIYKKYKWHGIPHKLRIPENVKAIFQNAGFRKIKTATIPYTEKRTIKDSVGLIKTSSEYALLSAEEKKCFITEMTAAYKKALKGKDVVSTKKEICICYGFK